MQQLLIFFIRLCLFREDPADSPKAPAFLATVVVIYALLSFTILMLGDGMAPSSLVTAIALGLGIEAGATIALLRFRNVVQRFIPTMSALLASSALLNLVMMPVTMIAELLGTAMLALVGWVALFWWVAVAGFILQRAANLSFGQAAAFAFTIQLVYLATLGSLSAS